MPEKPSYEEPEQSIIELRKESIERKRVEEALRKSEEKYRDIFENVSDFLYFHDLEGNLVETNLAWKRQFGYSDEDLAQLNIRDLIPQRYRHQFDEYLRRVQENGSDEGLMRVVTKDGSERIVEYRNSLVLEEKRPIGVRGSGRDITERVQTEKALRESEEKYRNLVERAREGIAIVQNDVLKYVNHHLAEMVGHTVDELTDTPFSDYIHPDALPSVLETHSRRMAGEEVPSTYEAAVRHKDGSRVDVEIDVGLITYQGSPAVFAIVRDLTERRHLEAQLRLAQKMEALGTLAGGIAHNFNNLLTAIMGNTSLMLLGTDADHPSYENLKNIEKLVESGAKLTKQLLGYAREGSYEVRPISLNQVVKNTAETFATTRKDITVHQELAGDLLGIRADQGQAEQVLLNLYVNAADAMPGGGDLFLKTMNVTDRDMKGKPYRPRPGAYVLLRVRDTGIGMDKETMQRVFDPFFTTKGMGRGTGLGLASVYGIVKAHGGYIDVDSEKGRGSTFYLYFPATERRAEEDLKSIKHLNKGNGTVLLVDDEEMVLEVGLKMLRKLGFTVLGAKGGREAIDIYETHKDEIDLVILDMIMPAMGGGETYDKMKELNPNAKVLLSSGYSINGHATEILNRGCDGFIQKPFKMEELSGKVTKLLE
jgi:two-component system cell cycle sensor histidine kinase/response regulator CckA